MENWKKIHTVRKNAQRIIREYRKNKEYVKADALVHKLKLLKKSVLNK